MVGQVSMRWSDLPDSKRIGFFSWLLSLGLLLLPAVGLLAAHDLTRTGAEPLRRANQWCRRIAGRSHWPVQLADCRTVPEAIALRAAIREEPGPALALLSDPRPEVQTAALGAL